jgi:hypothetical protein
MRIFFSKSFDILNFVFQLKEAYAPGIKSAFLEKKVDTKLSSALIFIYSIGGATTQGIGMPLSSLPIFPNL